MSDDDKATEDKSQDDIDAMFDGDAAGGGDTAGGDDDAAAADAAEGMNLDEIGTDPTVSTENDFEIGEPMADSVTAIYDIPVQISAVLGKSTMQVSQLLKLGRGAVVELDRKVGEAIDIYVNNRLVARGEVVVVDDKLGVTMTEIVKSDQT